MRAEPAAGRHLFFFSGSGSAASSFPFSVVLFFFLIVGFIVCWWRLSNYERAGVANLLRVSWF